MKAIAIHTVHVGVEEGKLSEDGKRVVKPANVDEHKPGTIFEIDTKRFEDLKRLGAVREPTALELKIADTGGHVDPAELRAAQMVNVAPPIVKPADDGKSTGDDKPAAGGKGADTKAAGDNLLG